MSPTKLPPSFSSARPTHRFRSPAALSSMLFALPLPAIIIQEQNV